MVLVVKNLPANTGDVRDRGLIPGLGRSPGGGHGTLSSICPWKTPWTEKPGELWSIALPRVRHDCNNLASTQGREKKESILEVQPLIFLAFYK